MLQTENDYKLALALLSGVGYSTYHRCIDYFGSAEQVFHVGATERKASKIFTVKTLNAFNDSLWKILEQHQKWVTNQQHIILYTDDAYPQQLKTIDSPPLFLMVKGNLNLLTDPQIAIVGTRSCTKMGRNTAFNFAKELVSKGLTITSGMATGIDSAAHLGALANHGDTIVVLGNDIEKIYPTSNTNLYNEIVDKGTIISEFPLGMQPLPQNFPRRNRIITGLSEGLLIVEAKIASGTMTSAKHALNQGKEIFAVPSSINNPLAQGCHKLIKEGANLVDSVDDIMSSIAPRLSHLPYFTPNKSTVEPVILPSKLNKNIKATVKEKNYKQKNTNSNDELNEALKQLDTTQLLILNAVDFSPTSLEFITQTTNHSVALCQAALLTLELDGFILVASAGRYQRIK